MAPPAAGTAVAEHAAIAVADSIWEQIRYVFDYENNITNLKAKVDALELAKRRVEVEVKAAEGKLERIQQDVLAWLDNVGKEIANAREILEDDANGNECCCFNFLPDVRTRYVFSRRAVDKALLVSTLATQSFSSIGYATTIKGFVPPAYFEAFESRQGTFDSIVKLLKHGNGVNVVGVWGPGGVGKTVLVKKVAQLVEDEEVFETVLLASATVTHDPDPDLTKITEDIAKCLNFKLGDGADQLKASRLFDRLKQEKSILIILDDAWWDVKMDKIGIPLGGDDGNRVCKILVTSRSKKVVLGIGATEESCLHLEGLPMDEAWEVFSKTVGSMKDPDIIVPIAKEVVIRCSGLPVLLLPVAKALKNKELSIWKDALYQLKKLDGKLDMREKTYAALELSYNFLNDDMKNVFILAARAGPRYIDLKLLSLYAIGLGLFKNLETLAQVRNMVHRVVDNLASSSLLGEETSSWFEGYRMHDVVHSFAISLACKKDNYFWCDSLRKWPRNEILNKCTSIHLSDCKIPEVPEVLPCPNLEMLVLDSVPLGPSLATNFFSETKKLRVLHLAGFSLLPLPSSFTFLENLESLRIRHCEVEDISIIGGLTKLQILSLGVLPMAYLPLELKGLRCLRQLELWCCHNLKKIPKEIVPYWTELEELDISGSPVELDNDDRVALRSLPQFTTLLED